ncbi:MAG: YihY/virulence factor BrkB family protein [Haloferacaceae archaeon]
MTCSTAERAHVPAASIPALARTVLYESRRRDVPTFAASIAYYAFVSLVPLLALAVVLAAAVGGPRLEAAVLGLAESYLLPTGRELVVDAFRNTAGRAGTTLLGLPVLAWSAFRLFRGVHVAFARVYGAASDGVVEQARDAALVVASVGVGTAAVGVSAGAVGGLLPRDSPLGLAAPVVAPLALALALFPLYYVFPGVRLTPREAVPGTLFTAVGWTALGAGFGAYAAYASTSGAIALYGLLGGLVLLVTWFYFAGAVLLVGAVLNAVLAGRLDGAGDRQVQQAGDRDDRR